MAAGQYPDFFVSFIGRSNRLDRFFQRPRADVTEKRWLHQVESLASKVVCRLRLRMSGRRRDRFFSPDPFGVCG
ncbi:uncharacterized protein METZ01_LOCUS175757 [marine metagenome]|uniref:Uncharacterized protein n=1 Tax=marine metagenome TaxID=408172 RepID=A0A382CC85_9ZZZZ